MLHNRKYQNRRYELLGSHATTTSKHTAMSPGHIRSDPSCRTSCSLYWASCIAFTHALQNRGLCWGTKHVVAVSEGAFKDARLPTCTI